MHPQTSMSCMYRRCIRTCMRSRAALRAALRGDMSLLYQRFRRAFFVGTLLLFMARAHIARGARRGGGWMGVGRRTSGVTLVHHGDDANRRWCATIRMTLVHDLFHDRSRNDSSRLHRSTIAHSFRLARFDWFDGTPNTLSWVANSRGTRGRVVLSGVATSATRHNRATRRSPST